ncbi:MAG: hypothetical protein ABJZ55_23895 [Fuerstiella sp.]
MRPQLISKTIHAYLDYPVAISLIVMPFILKLGESHPVALQLSVGTGIAAFLLTLLTDHQFGVVRVLPYSFHLAVDFAVGVVFLIAPFALGFTGIDAGYYWANALAVLAVVGLHRPVVTTEVGQVGSGESLA